MHFYSRMIMSLEEKEAEKLNQLDQLATENESLRQRLRALEHVAAVAGNSASDCSYQAAAIEAAVFSALASLDDGQQQQQQQQQQVQQLAPPAAMTTPDKQAQVEATLHRLGFPATYEELYTTRLLIGLIAKPARVQELCDMSPVQRLQQLKAAVKDIGMWLPRYNDDWAARQHVDKLLEASIEAKLVWSFQDGTLHNLGLLMVDLETHAPSPYRQHWWPKVAEEIELDDAQKAALRKCWGFVKASSTELLEHLAHMDSRLKEMQAENSTQHRLFAQQMHKLFEQERRGGGGTRGGHAAAGGDGDATDALAWDVCSEGQQLIEQQMSQMVRHLALLYSVLELALFNILSKEQLAKGVAMSFPYSLDAVSVCEALDEGGW